MKEELERYILATYRRDLAERNAGFTLGYLSVDDYSDEFLTPSSHAQVDEPKYITVGRYKRGFKKPIRDASFDHHHYVRSILDHFQC